ncbi:MAG TPA: NPCBM/NEW2 domain-containing protein [Planctomycetota bacterium]|nr:NPCBM/NEW2 domain-containing protein [Planctomycetota bacterium]
MKAPDFSVLQGQRELDMRKLAATHAVAEMKMWLGDDPALQISPGFGEVPEDVASNPGYKTYDRLRHKKEGFFSFGPYERSTGEHFRVCWVGTVFDRVTDPDAKVLSVDIFDADADKVLAKHTFYVRDFASDRDAFVIQSERDFRAPAKHRLEYRILAHGVASLRLLNLIRLSIQRSDGASPEPPVAEKSSTLPEPKSYAWKVHSPSPQAAVTHTAKAHRIQISTYVDPWDFRKGKFPAYYRPLCPSGDELTISYSLASRAESTWAGLFLWDEDFNALMANIDGGYHINIRGVLPEDRHYHGNTPEVMTMTGQFRALYTPGKVKLLYRHKPENLWHEIETIETDAEFTAIGVMAKRWGGENLDCSFTLEEGETPVRDGPRLVYLADLDEQEVKVGFGEFGKKGDMGYHNWRVEVKNRLYYTNSLSLHPGRGEPSHVAYRLGGAFRTLRTEAAMIDHWNTSESPMTFKVLGDGKKLWQSKPIKRHKQPQPCEVDISGIDKLELEVHCAGGNNNCGAVWVDPQVVK